MSFLRALRAYVGLGPDEEIEDRYLYELNSRRRVLDLDELEHDDDDFVGEYADADLDELDLRRLRVNAANEPEIDLRDYEADETVQVRPRTRRPQAERLDRDQPGSGVRNQRGTRDDRPDRDARRGAARRSGPSAVPSGGVFDEDDYPTDEFGDDESAGRASDGRASAGRASGAAATASRSVRRVDDVADDFDDLLGFDDDQTGDTPGDGDESLDRVTAEFLAKKSPFETEDDPTDNKSLVAELAASGFADQRTGGPDDDDIDAETSLADVDFEDAGFEVASVDDPTPSARGSGRSKRGGSTKNARTVERDADEDNKMRRGGSTRSSSKRSGGAAETTGRDRSDRAADDGVVRSLDSMRAKPRTLLPESFADAKLVADEFKRGVPVLLNLQGLDRDLARRLIDFASGICYALDGSMEKIASQVFLLIPDGAEVSDEDRRRIEERGYAR